MECVEASATTSDTGNSPLGENAEHLATDIAGGADHRDLEA